MMDNKCGHSHHCCGGHDYENYCGGHEDKYFGEHYGHHHCEHHHCEDLFFKFLMHKKKKHLWHKIAFMKALVHALEEPDSDKRRYAIISILRKKIDGCECRLGKFE